MNGLPLTKYEQATYLAPCAVTAHIGGFLYGNGRQTCKYVVHAMASLARVGYARLRYGLYSCLYCMCTCLHFLLNYIIFTSSVG